MRVIKEMEDKFEKWIDERVQEKVNVLMASMGSGVVPQEPIRLALAHSLGVTTAMDRPHSTMSGCTSVSNGQLTRWRSVRPGLWETEPLMATQFQ